MKTPIGQSRRVFIKNTFKKCMGALLLWISGCQVENTSTLPPEQTATPISSIPITEDESTSNNEQPTSTPDNFKIKPDLMGDLVIICGESLSLDGEQITYPIILFEDWLDPNQYIKQNVIIGKVIGEGLLSRDYEGRTVLDTNSLSGEETCVIGFEYGEQFIGINVSFKDLTRDYPIKTRFNGVLEFHGQTYKFNTFYYIPQIDRGGGGSSDSGGGSGDGGSTSGGAVVGQTIGG